MSRVIVTVGDWLAEALKSLDGSALLVSPYLSEQVGDWLVGAVKGSIHPFILVTCLNAEAAASKFLSVKALRRLLETGVEIQHVPNLHAKCFVLGTRGMLGSANLTGAGLGWSTGANRELGVELNAQQLAEARKVISSWQALRVTASDLDDLLSKSRRLTPPSRTRADALDADTALHVAQQLLADADDGQRKLWLKMHLEGPVLDSWREPWRLASSKRGKPRFVPGDLVVICAKDGKHCYAVVEVTHDPEDKPKDYVKWTAKYYPDDLKRWPWVTRTKPRLVPGELIDLTISDLGIKAQALQNGHIRLDKEAFKSAVGALGRLTSV